MPGATHVALTVGPTLDVVMSMSAPGHSLHRLSMKYVPSTLSSLDDALKTTEEIDPVVRPDGTLSLNVARLSNDGIFTDHSHGQYLGA
jgi:hypothetical protein